MQKREASSHKVSLFVRIIEGLGFLTDASLSDVSYYCVLQLKNKQDKILSSISTQEVPCGNTVSPRVRWDEQYNINPNNWIASRFSIEVFSKRHLDGLVTSIGCCDIALRSIISGIKAWINLTPTADTPFQLCIQNALCYGELVYSAYPSPGGWSRPNQSMTADSPLIAAYWQQIIEKLYSSEFRYLNHLTKFSLVVKHGKMIGGSTLFPAFSLNGIFLEYTGSKTRVGSVAIRGEIETEKLLNLSRVDACVNKIFCTVKNDGPVQCYVTMENGADQAKEMVYPRSVDYSNCIYIHSVLMRHREDVWVLKPIDLYVYVDQNLSSHECNQRLLKQIGLINRYIFY